MMYTLGKTIHTTMRAAIAAMVLLAFASCVNPLTDSAPDKTPDSPVGAAPNRVTLSIAVKTDASRIVLPDASPLASYRLFGSFAGGSLAELGTWTSLSAATVIVASGEWDFTLDGYDGDGVLILTGSIDDRNVTDGTTLSFSLRDIESGTGSVSVNLLWPYADNLVTSVTAIFDETTTTLTPSAAPPAGFVVTYSNASVGAGDYLLTFRMLDSDGMTVATVTEWVLVRKDLASKKDIALASTDLNYVPAMPSTIVITEGVLGWSSLAVNLDWSDNSDNETGFRVEYSDDGDTWQLAANVDAGVASYSETLPRGIYREYRIHAFNDFGTSEPATIDYASLPLTDFRTSDDSIVSVTVNLWDPVTLAFHGTFELTRYGYYFGGGGEPTELGPQLIQAYAYDAAGKIRAVAEINATIEDINYNTAVGLEPVRLMGGNVQKTGVSIGNTPVIVKSGEVGIDCINAMGMTCDGLNLYVGDSVNNLIKRQVISSKAVALFAGAGAGSDEDNPGNSPSYDGNDVWGLTTDGKCLYVGLRAAYQIARLSFTASSRVLVTLPEDEENFANRPRLLQIVTDGTCLYGHTSRIHRLDLNNLVLTHLDPADWTWKSTNPGGTWVGYGLTMNDTNLFWNDYNTGDIRSMPLGGVSSTTFADTGIGINCGATTDGSSLYYFVPRQAEPTLSDFYKVDSTTGAKTSLGNAAGNYAYLIATDGISLFGYAD